MFIIFSNQRAGSHLLQELLNNHPDLTCYDEILVPSTKYPNVHIYEMGDKEGCLVKYLQASKVDYKKLKGAKVIKLNRDLRKMAISKYIVDHKIAKAVSEKRQDFKIDIPNEKLNKEIKDLGSWEDSAIPILKEFNDIFEIDYYDICQDKEIEVWKEEDNKELLEFLGVKPMDLHTKLKKVNNENLNCH